MPVTDSVSPPASPPTNPIRPRGSNGGTIRKILLVVFLVGVAALVVWKIKANKREADALTAQSDADANQAVPVSVATVVAKPMPIYLTELGTVTAFNTVTVKSRVDGQLFSVNVREGQAVHQGQLLATIDPRPYQAALDQAKGQLVKDEAASDYAKAESARYTALLEAGVVSKESQQTQISSAGQSAGALATDRAAIEAARVNLVYTRIESPIDGVVGLRQVDAGNVVHATDTTGLIVVTQLQPISVIFTLPEDQLPQVLKLLHAGHTLEVEALDRAQATHLANGTVVTVDNQIDTTTGTVKVKAVFPNADGALFPNQFVNVRLVLERRPRSLVIPAAALQSGSQGNFVYVARPCPAAGCPRPEPGPGSEAASASASTPGDAKFYADIAKITVDLTEGTQLILKSGVEPGEAVIIDGQEKLKRFSPIVPRAAASAEQGQ